MTFSALDARRARPAAAVVTGGVDTHKDTHTAAVLDPCGRMLGHRQFPTCRCRELCHGLCSAFSPPADVAVTVRSPRCMIPRCDLPSRLPAARLCAEPAVAARTIRRGQRRRNPGPPSRCQAALPLAPQRPLGWRRWCGAAPRSIRMVTENRAPLQRPRPRTPPRSTRIRAHHDQTGDPGQPRGGYCLGDPGGRAPAEPEFPPRNRAAARPARQRGVTVAASTSTREPAGTRGDLGVSERGALLVPPYTRRCAESMSMNATVSAPGSNGVRAANSTTHPAVYRGELADVAVVERPQETAQRGWGPNPADRVQEPPCRSRSIPSMVSTPATIPATSARISTPGLARFRGHPPCRRAVSRPISGQSHAGISPACDTGFG